MFWLLSAPAIAQKLPIATSAPEPVYAVVEQMPQLPGGGGSAAVVTFLQQHVVYPAPAAQARAEGRVFVSFTVSPAGKVMDAAVAKSFRPDCDSAALAGVRQLPRFEPGQQMGRPVPVRFTLPVTFRLPAAQAAPSDSTKQVYTYVEQMPLYQGEEGTKSLSEDLLREFRAVGGSGCPVPSFQILVSMKVGPSGTIYDVKSLRNQSAYPAAKQPTEGRGPLPSACDQALAAAARKLPRLTPGTQNGRRVAVSYTFLLNSSGQ
ncbi:energy transducer TonB [Hymenobacter monticola]|uniref:Energy transducer TonB n=1 Tax=Hymenobacter monticola TaxID=1705399 RepID=A0ABY4B6T4_9BACT|nr:energy transducer TonB [Hymenobacter monticola]UOE34882.1 energy transducer TonB [Hymenobacter monticola]